MKYTLVMTASSQPQSLFPQAQEEDLSSQTSEALSASEARIGRFVLPVPAEREFDYLIPQPFRGLLKRGMRASVEFGKRKLTGYCVQVLKTSPLPDSKLKPVLELPDQEPLVDEGIMRLTRWMADYYACSWGEALDAVIPGVIRRKKALKSVNVLRLGKSPEQVSTFIQELRQKAEKSANSPSHKQAKILQTLLDFEHENFRPNTLVEKLGYSLSPVNTLRKAGWLRLEAIPFEEEAYASPVFSSEEHDALTSEQEKVLERIYPKIEQDEYQTFLLKGVTGSGKTEVYIHALKHALSLGKGGIILVPEISLTSQTVERFVGRLGSITEIAVLHSGMTDKERRKAWKAIVSGQARIVIGARSAVFAPVKDLGLLVVDEEHEPSYKQDTTPRYHARDVAIMRCHQQQAVCILGSATPALESAYNAAKGRYQLLEIKRRVFDRTLPHVVVIDMAEECRMQRRFTHFSNQLLQAIKRALEAKQQVVLFLNRRGYHTFFQCTNCRSLMSCPNCEVPMSLHKEPTKLVCHYCYETTARPSICPHCQVGRMEACGIGTEKLEDDLQKLFPQARIARMDSDAMKKREDYEGVLEPFRAGELDILVGTQMIAKGLDFPKVTVVGVIHADLNLYLADFRAQERSFQLLTQVAGRAGRGKEPGMVFVQTFSPDHPCIRAAQSQDYSAFFYYEIEQRKAALYPPYIRLCNITIEARDRKRGLTLGKKLRAELDDLMELEKGSILKVLGPAEAPLSRIRGRYRSQILVKVPDHKSMSIISQRMRKHLKSSENLRVILDVDPYSLL